MAVRVTLRGCGLLVSSIGGLALWPAAGAGAAAPPAARSAAAQREVARWAYPQAAAVIRSAPSGTARVVGRMHFLTEDGQAEVYAVLAVRYVPQRGTGWTKVAVPKRPNGITGWVPSRSLSPPQDATQRLTVDRTRLRATLYARGGRVLWSAPVGVGKRATPTPAGHFYIREKLRAIGSPAYGPFALGTSAYAPTLSEWPGGGVIGIHGTDAPQLIPGRPSHGCVRLRNADIVRLWRLIQVGTPVDIT